MTWRTASFCQSGECGQVAAGHDDDLQGSTVLIRSSRQPGLVAEMSYGVFADFQNAIRAGLLDDLLEETE
jgi:hypothetical protein